MSFSDANLNMLHIEDNEIEVALVREAFANCGSIFNIFNAPDGETGLKMLKKSEKEFQSLPSFDLVLLDLGLPNMDGFEVLETIRNDKEHFGIPVIVLSGKDKEININKCYEIGANCFVSKLEGIEGYNKIANNIKAFWLSSVDIPNVIDLEDR